MDRKYIWFKQHIYVAFFGTQAILLDLKKDFYYLLTPTYAAIVKDLLKGKLFFEKDSFISSSGKQPDKTTTTFIQTVQSLTTIHSTIYPYYLFEQKETKGISNIDWRLPLEGVNLSVQKGLILEALTTLVKIHSLMALGGFNWIINLIKKSKDPNKVYFIPKPEKIQIIVDALNAACLLFPKRSKCLEWSISLVLLALKRQWHCNLNIGVQFCPFLAHAWVETNGNIIADSDELPKKMSIILQEPFRKEIKEDIK